MEKICLFRLLPTVLPHRFIELDRGFVVVVVVVLTWLEWLERDDPQRTARVLIPPVKF